MKFSEISEFYSDSDSESSGLECNYGKPYKYNCVTNIEDEINNGELSKIVNYLKHGYNTEYSFRGCVCCYEPDDLTRCYHRNQLDIFEILLPKTTPILLDRVKIYDSPKAIPYIRLMQQYIDIPPKKFLCYVEKNSDFSKDDLNSMLKVINKTDDSINYSDLENLILTSSNKKYYEELLISGKLDKNKTLLYAINKCDLLHRATKKEFASIGKLCIKLGASTSKPIKFSSNYYYLMKYLLNPGLTINPNSLCTTMSLDTLHDKISRFKVVNDILHTLNKGDIDFIREIYEESIVVQSVLTIQCFVRTYNSKKIANILRLNPDNLFDINFSQSRKKILKIDDTKFIVT